MNITEHPIRMAKTIATGKARRKRRPYERETESGRGCPVPEPFEYSAGYSHAYEGVKNRIQMVGT